MRNSNKEVNKLWTVKNYIFIQTSLVQTSNCGANITVKFIFINGMVQTSIRIHIIYDDLMIKFYSKRLISVVRIVEIFDLLQNNRSSLQIMLSITAIHYFTTSITQ